MSTCIDSSSCEDPVSGYNDAVAAPMNAVIRFVEGGPPILNLSKMSEFSTANDSSEPLEMSINSTGLGGELSSSILNCIGVWNNLDIFRI